MYVFFRFFQVSALRIPHKWGRDLNEGVPRIYDEMKGSSLDKPTFSETPGNFKLILRNNIVAWQLLQGKKIEKDAGEQGLVGC